MTTPPPVTYIATRDIPLADLREHPDNPNHGDVDAIQDSLDRFGQFRSVIALEDGTLLGGHHVVAAAKARGDKTIRVEVIDTDPDTAKAILLADNKLAELGYRDDAELLVLLQAIPDLAGTGYTDTDIEFLAELTAGAPELDDLHDEVGDPTDDDGLVVIRLKVEPGTAKLWDNHRASEDTDTAALAALLADPASE